jgi:hypothetical protein
VLLLDLDQRLLRWLAQCWTKKEFMSGNGQKAKYSRRAHVFRFTSDNGHAAATPQCPFGANSGLNLAHQRVERES